MQKLLLTLLLASLSALTFSQTSWQWAKSAEGIYNYMDYGSGIATDATGNILITGYFHSPSLMFDTIILTNTAIGRDFFVAKYDASGNILWARNGGGTFHDQAYSVATDAANNVLVAGSFRSSSMVLGIYTLTNSGGTLNDMFVAKYDSSGNVIWAVSAGGTGNEEAYSVATDPSGNVLVTGYFDSPSITFGSVTLTNSGSTNIFVVKYNSSGYVLWARTAVSHLSVIGNSISTDSNGNVLVTGDFNGDTLVFGNTILTIPVSIYNDVFVVKYDASGNALWARSAGGVYIESAKGICSDVNGNVLVAGYFGSPTATFGIVTLANSDPNGSDIFVAKYDAAGNVVWARSAGMAGGEYACGIATDASSNVYATGRLGPITFGSTTITDAGGTDVVIMKYDSSGTELGAVSTGGADDDVSQSIAIDGGGNVLVTGYFGSPSITFGSSIITSSGNDYDIFVAKFSGNILTGGLERHPQENIISVFPNPATNELTVRDPGLGDKTEIEIYNVVGEKIYFSQEETKNRKQLSINVSKYSPGIYFLKLVGKKEERMVKFLKQ